MKIDGADRIIVCYVYRGSKFVVLNVLTFVNVLTFLNVMEVTVLYMFSCCLLFYVCVLVRYLHILMLQVTFLDNFTLYYGISLT